MSTLHSIKNINYKTHLIIAFAIRLGFIIYGEHHDKVATVPYTDIDYRVFTDAARHVISYESPYNRHTYRYSPLIALLLIPNVLLHESFGKVLFSVVDILVGCLIRVIVKNIYKTYMQHVAPIQIENVHKTLPAISNCSGTEKWGVKQGSRSRRKNKSSIFKNVKVNKDRKVKNDIDVTADMCMCIWLYNPLSIAIATRGNSDSIAGFLVLSVLYYLQVKQSYFIAGVIHGIAVHVRLYPIIYSLSLFMYLSKFSFYETEDRKTLLKNEMGPKQLKNNENNTVVTRKNVENTIMQQKIKAERKTIFRKQYLLYLLPNSSQLQLVSGCLLSVVALTGLFFWFYGYQFLYETYIYHIVRHDSRHNFSLYFYLQYLTAGVKNIGMWQKVLITLPKIVLLLVLSIRYGLNKYSLNFSMLTQTLVIVIYNTVLTSQYFIWILSILPLCIWQIKINFRRTLTLFTLWFAAQIAWLLPAYFLEFQGQNTFFLIWLQSISLFCAHIAILGRLIRYFVPLSSHED